MRRAWQGHHGPSGPASSETPPPPQGGTESSQARACKTAWRKQVHWNGFLLPPYLQRARVSFSNGQTCWKPLFPGDTHRPSAGHSVVCLAILTHGPKSATRYWWPGGPRLRGLGSRLDQEAPACQGEESLWPHPRPAHKPRSWCQFCGWAGTVLGHKETQMITGTSQAPDTPLHPASPHTANC